MLPAELSLPRGHNVHSINVSSFDFLAPLYFPPHLCRLLMGYPTSPRSCSSLPASGPTSCHASGSTLEVSSLPALCLYIMVTRSKSTTSHPINQSMGSRGLFPRPHLLSSARFSSFPSLRPGSISITSPCQRRGIFGCLREYRTISAQVASEGRKDGACCELKYNTAVKDALLPSPPSDPATFPETPRLLSIHSLCSRVVITSRRLSINRVRFFA